MFTAKKNERSTQMPWEKSFDEDDVLVKAMSVFWEKGYESASISDLLDRTGINKGSLYNAFGGKKQLFLKALMKYDQDNRKAVIADLEARDDPKNSIPFLLDNLVAETVADAGKKGCFLINTASEIATHGSEVVDLVTRGLGEMEAFFRRSIEVGQVRGDFSKELDPAATAKALLGVIVAIRVLGRGVFTEDALYTVADQGKRLVA